MRPPRELLSAIIQFVFIAQTCLPVAEIDNPSIDVSRFNVRGEIKRVAVGNGFNLPHRVPRGPPHGVHRPLREFAGRHASLFLIHSLVGRIGGAGKAIIERRQTAETENPLQ
jgi:hypothetical protein